MALLPSSGPLGLGEPPIEWREDGSVYNTEYGDRYSHLAAVAEAKHVFIEPHSLLERLGCSIEAGCDFRIFELGFGLGVNFCTVLTELLGSEVYSRVSDNGFRLLYTAVEKSPPKIEQIKSHLRSLFGSNFSLSWLDAYPENFIGKYRIIVEKNVVLDLIHADVETVSDEIPRDLDLVMLDGFSPRCNQQMWEPVLLRELASKLKPGGTLSSFSSASFLRRSLESHGLHIAKLPGFSGKREMIFAQKPSGEIQTVNPETTYSYPGSLKTKVAIIGGGLAGCSVAWSLKARGIDCRIYEKAWGYSAGSASRQSVMMPHLTAGASYRTFFLLSGYFYTLSLLRHLQSQNLLPVAHCGVFRTLSSSRLKAVSEQLEALKVRPSFSHPAHSSRWHIDKSCQGLYFPSGISLNLEELCSALVVDAGVDISYGWDTSALRKTSRKISGKISRKTLNSWEITSSDGRVTRAETVIICSGQAAESLGLNLPLDQIKGQLIKFRSSQSSGKLGLAFCDDGYLCPPDSDGLQSLGSSYERGYQDLVPTREVTEKLLETGKTLYSDIDPSNLQETLVGTRISVLDKLPIVGRGFSSSLFENYRCQKLQNIDENTVYNASDQTLLMSLAHGSHGLMSAPISAELVADYLCGSPPALPRQIRRQLYPPRFEFRRLNQEGLGEKRGLFQID